MDDLACMLGVLPHCFRLNVAEPDRSGQLDYIIEQGDVDLPSSEELLKIGSPDASSKKLQLRLLAFHCALIRLVNKCENAPKSFEEVNIPRQLIESIRSLQKKQHAKMVESFYPDCPKKRVPSCRHASSRTSGRINAQYPEREHA